MPFYYELDNRKPEDRRTAEGVLRLKEALRSGRNRIPARTREDTLLLATWNIREFGRSKHGLRGNEPLYYIAEIVSHFDLVAVQEVRGDLRLFRKLMDILGGWWRFLISDVTLGSGGNDERMVFLYDTRKVQFEGLASEIVLPTPLRQSPVLQLARTPYLAGFRSGWFRFALCVVHIYYGESVADDPRRTREIEQLAQLLAKMAAKERDDAKSFVRNLVLLGDFNIFHPDDVTFRALTDAGFHVPEQIQKLPSNIDQKKHYDQIAFLAPEQQQRLADCAAGVFPFFQYVYRDADAPTYADQHGETAYRTWRTFQMSDHLPMWIELKVDFGTEYLQARSRPPA